METDIKISVQFSSVPFRKCSSARRFPASCRERCLATRWWVAGYHGFHVEMELGPPSLSRALDNVLCLPRWGCRPGGWLGGILLPSTAAKSGSKSRTSHPDPPCDCRPLVSLIVPPFPPPPWLSISIFVWILLQRTQGRRGPFHGHQGKGAAAGRVHPRTRDVSRVPREADPRNEGTLPSHAQVFALMADSVASASACAPSPHL